MTYATLPLLLALLALLAYALLEALRSRIPSRLRVGALALLVGVALVSHLRLIDRDAEGDIGIARPLPHLNEFWHYYVGTKYFDALGYHGLYAAGVVADHEDDPGGFRPDAPVRDLETYRMVRRAQVLEDAERIKAPFPARRWEQFKADVRLLRESTRPGFWEEGGFSVDHGYNGTPLVTALLGGLALQPWLDTPAFVDLMRWADLYLLLLLGVLVAALEGAAPGLTLLLLLFANPLNDYGFTGGAYLRSPWLVSLALALLALRRGWQGAAGALFAVSGGLRIFPLVFPGLLLLRDLVPRDRGARLRRRARLHGSFVLAALALVAATSWIPMPDGRNPWRAFAENMALHAGTLGANQVGVQVPFRYSRENDSGELSRPGWRDRAARILRERRVPHAVCVAVLVGLALAWLRRAEGPAVLLPGLLLVIATLPLAHYYWAVLGLVPLAVAWERRVLLLLAAVLVTLSITVLPLFWNEAQDLRFSWISLQVLAFLLAAYALGSRSGAPGPRALAAALLAGAWLGCSADSGRPSATELVQDDTWRSRAVGLELRKPAAWVFLAETSLRQEQPQRVTDPARLWEILEKPALKPLVATAPSTAPGAPTFRAYLIPPRAGESETGLRRLRKLDPLRVLEANVGRRAMLPDYELLDPARPARIGGLEGAQIRVAYRPEAAGGSATRRVERRWVARDDVLYFYFEGIAAAPVPAEIDRQFEQILASVRFQN